MTSQEPAGGEDAADAGAPVEGRRAATPPLASAFDGPGSTGGERRSSGAAPPSVGDLADAHLPTDDDIADAVLLADVTTADGEDDAVLLADVTTADGEDDAPLLDGAEDLPTSPGLPSLTPAPLRSGAASGPAPAAPPQPQRAPVGSAPQTSASALTGARAAPASAAASGPRPPGAAASPTGGAASGGDFFEPLWRRLIREEVSLDVAEQVVQAAREILPPERRTDPQAAWLAAARAMVDLVQTAGPLRVKRDRCTVMALVGPTGVGKSTTLAKLAAIAALKERRTVAIVTTDTYRVAATEQVKTYGRLLRIPVVVARGPDELAAAFERHRFRDLLLVDTAGQSPNDTGRLADLGEMIGDAPTVKRLLVMSATTKTGDAQDIVRRFGTLGLDGLLFTKLDESRTHGVILDSAVGAGLPLTYFGVGQAVPQDIEIASVARVASLLLPLGS